MKIRIQYLFAVAIIATLTGCATNTIRSQVTVFHEWPQTLAERTFAFDATTPQQNDLEYKAYENQLRAALQRVGLSDAGTLQHAALRVNFEYGSQVRDVRIVEPAYNGFDWEGPPFGLYRGRGYGGGFYDPFWYSRGGGYRDISYQLFTRRLNVQITRTADSKKIYDVTVRSEGRNGALAAVMPAMIRSAFADFPGQSGSARVIDLPADH